MKLLSDVLLKGTLNAAGADLHVTTPHLFSLQTGSAFYANDYHIEAEQVFIQGEFHTPPGGTARITNNDANTGAIFSGYGITNSAWEPAWSPPSVYLNELLEMSFVLNEIGILTVVPSNFVSSVPLPASVFPMSAAVGLIFFRRIAIS